MTLQGTLWDVLQAIADIQEVFSIETVEDTQIAEEVELDVNIVRRSLKDLAEAGYVELETEETLSNLKYNACLTEKGKTVLVENRPAMAFETL
jgi:Mn-dependent DtxR family transcriptional regulator